jgi:multiple sugar transport system permease protein/raffinose/stachyose/melibiose transport system permease protein
MRMMKTEKRRYSPLNRDYIGYWMIAPFYLFLIVFVIFPILINIFFSFTNFNLRTVHFVGFQNYLRLFSDETFMVSMQNTFVYTFFTLVFTMALGLMAALMVNKKLIGLKFFRTSFYMPYITSMVAGAMIWLWMYDPSYGIFNQVLGFFGIQSRQWLYDANLAMGCIILMSIWKSLGYFMVIYLAGLQSIPAYLYEAATVDGASSFRQFCAITLPMLRPVTFFLFVTGIVNNFKVFEQVMILTNGGPMNATTTIVHQIYNRGFIEFQMGYAAALSIILLLIISGITLFNFKYGNQGQDLDIG